MNFRRYIALLLLLVLTLGAFACNNTDADAEGSETPEATDAPTEKATKKPKETEGSTEPPAVLENVDGLDLDIKLLSQNLYSLDAPNGNSIDERASRFEAMISEIKPDVIATQEGNKEWVGKLKKLDKYGFSGFSSYGERSMGGLWNAILYNEERFVLMDEGSFWINDEVKKPGLASGAMDKRICSWVELFDKYTGGSLVVASAQLDHACDAVRLTELGQLTRALKGNLGKRYNNMPVYLALDLKCEVDGDVYYDMIANRGFDDARNLALEDRSEGFGSNHFFGNAEKGREECFWFAREYGEVLSYEVMNSKYKGKNDTEAGFVSDHYGILLTIGALK